MTRDKIILSEKDDSLQVQITMTSIMPCIRAIQQYEPRFKPQDIVDDETYFKGSIFETIAESFQDHLYSLINENRSQIIADSRGTASKDNDENGIDLTDFTELLQ